MPIEPAFHIPATDDELKMIGELVAIQGQIEFLMQQSLLFAAGLLPDAARTVLGSSGVRQNAEVWLTIMGSFYRDAPDPLAVSTYIHKEIASLSGGRNDFIHAFYAEEVGQPPYVGILYGPNPSPYRQGRYVAVRTRSGKRTPLTDLPEVRDRAAKISQILRQFVDWQQAQITTGIRVPTPLPEIPQ